MKAKSLQAVQIDLYRHFRGKVSHSDLVSINGFTFKAEPKTFSYINSSGFLTDRGWSSWPRLDVQYDVVNRQYTYEACPVEEKATPVQDPVSKIKSLDLQEGRIYQVESEGSIYLLKITFIGVSHLEALVVDPAKGLFYAAQFPFSMVETFIISTPEAKARKRFSDILYQHKVKGNDLPRLEDEVYSIKPFIIYPKH